LLGYDLCQKDAHILEKLMLYPSLLAVHVLSAIFWGGATMVNGFFVLPSIQSLGASSIPVVGTMMQRKFWFWNGMASGLAILSGLGMVALQAFNHLDWMWSTEGLVLEFGGLLALGAFVIGFTIQKPMAEKLRLILERIAEAKAPATAQQEADLVAIQARLGKATRIAAFHLLAASALMSIHTLLR
jgi:uncharacterized membrane protein